MKLAVIAASGRSGRAFVHEALAAGHVVQAGARSASPFEPHEGLTVMPCDATDVTQVSQLIEGCDAVVSLIGHVKGSQDFVQRDATKAIVTAMDTHGIKRFVSLTGVGVSTGGSRYDGLIKSISKISFKIGIKRFEDGIAHTKVLEASDLDWTVLKVLLLTNGDPGEFGLSTTGKVKAPTPRREVARAILKLLEDGSFIRAYPVVTKPATEPN